MRRALLLTTLSFSLLALSGCASIKGWFSHFPDMPELKGTMNNIYIRELKITSTNDTNGGSALRVNLIVVSNPQLMLKLNSMPANQFFGEKNSFRDNYPDGYEILEWDVIPGVAQKHDIELKESGSAIGGFIFADYDAEGAHRLKVTDEEYLTLHLGEKKMSLTSN